MEQRPLRLGDILDDYCPRERRVTNHAVVAMIEEDVKQTRCTTCDTEHVYKGGKAPRRKKPETTGALYKEVLAGITDQDAPPAAAAHAAPTPCPTTTTISTTARQRAGRRPRRRSRSRRRAAPSRPQRSTTTSIPTSGSRRSTKARCIVR